jgi:hypothetical protein
MTKPILTAHTAYGTFTRQTDRPYTHLVIFLPAEGQGEAEQCSWHLTESAAFAQSRKLAKLNSDRNLVPGQYAVAAIEHPAPSQEVVPSTTVMDTEPGSPAAALKAELAAASETETTPVDTETTPEPQETTEAVATADEPTDNLSDYVTPGEVLTRENAVGLVDTDWLVRQVGKALTHKVKLDKKDPTLARTLCGVPVHGASQNWLAIQPVDGLTCPTCRAAAAKVAPATTPAGQETVTDQGGVTWVPVGCDRCGRTGFATNRKMMNHRAQCRALGR